MMAGLAPWWLGGQPREDCNCACSSPTPRTAPFTCIAQFTWLEGYRNQFLLCICHGVYKLGNFHIINLGNFHICEVMLGTIIFEVDVTKHGAWASSVSNPPKLHWLFDKVIRLSYTLKFWKHSVVLPFLLFISYLIIGCNFYVILLCSPTSQKLTIQLRLDLHVD